MRKATSKPEMQIVSRVKAQVNEAFVEGLRRLHGKGSFVKNSPPGGMTLVHPQSDKDPNFEGGSQYDFYFRPSDPGHYIVMCSPGYQHLLEKDGDRFGAVITRG